MAIDSDSAGEAAAEYWRDMANDDSEEFASIIGTERLCLWALGKFDSYGFSCLEEFLDAAESVPEEQWATYDGAELDIEYRGDKSCELSVTSEAENEIGFQPTVAYRNN